MIRIALLWLMLLAPGAALSQAVTIRSGEHESFTRLVLTFPEGADWQLDKQSAAVVIEGAGVFDLSGVFDRIPRTRLSELRDAGGGKLSLRLGCTPCHLDAFLWQPGQLVVDIIDGPDPDGMLVSTQNEAEALPSVLPLFARTEAPAPVPFRAPAAGPEVEAPTSAPPDVTATSEIAEVLARGVAQGLLIPAETAVSPTPEAPSPPRPDPFVAAPAEVPTLPADTPGIVIGTSVDEGLSALSDMLAARSSELCLDAEVLDPARWTDGEDFAPAIVALKAGLFDGDGNTSREGAAALARGYLRFGLTAEARAWLEGLDGNDSAASWGRHLADIIDGRIDQSSPLEHQLSCDGPASAWLLLLPGSEMPPDRLDAAVQAFRLFPDPLRSQLSSRVIERLLAAGEVEHALAVLAAVSRLDVRVSPEFTSLLAVVEEMTGRPAAALELRETLADQDPRAPLADVYRTLATRLAEGRFTEADLLLLQSRKPEVTDPDLGDDFAELEIAGLARLGDFSSATQAASTHFANLPDGAVPPLADVLFLTPLAQLGDADFLDIAFADAPDWLTPALENRIAERLLSLGFAERAQAFLTGPAQREEMAVRRILRARAALELDQPEDALSALAGISSPEAEALRAKAFTALGAFDLAFQAADRAGLATGTDALRAAAFERLGLLPEDPLSPLARIAAETAPAPPETLSDRRDILGRSEETRAVIEALLEQR